MPRRSIIAAMLLAMGWMVACSLPGIGAESTDDAQTAAARKAVAKLSEFCASLTPEEHLAVRKWTVENRGRENNERYGRLVGDVKAAGKAATPVIIERLANAGKWERLWLLSALSALADPRAIDTFALYVKGDDHEIRGGAASGLAACGPPAIPALENLLREKNEAVRYEALRSLYSIAKEKECPAADRSRITAIAAKCQGDSSADVRLIAAVALAYGDATCDRPLIDLIGDQNPTVRRAATEAVLKRRQSNAVSALMAIILNRDLKDLHSRHESEYAVRAVAELAGLKLPPLKKEYREAGRPPHVVHLPEYTGQEEQRQFVLDWWEKEGKQKYAAKPAVP